VLNGNKKRKSETKRSNTHPSDSRLNPEDAIEPGVPQRHLIDNIHIVGVSFVVLQTGKERKGKGTGV
jgi:hypothetical protein